MDANVRAIKDVKLEKVKKNLEKHNMEAIIFETKEDVVNFLDETIASGSEVSFGGSETIKETGVLAMLQEKDIVLYDRYQPGLDDQAMKTIFRKAFFCDYYIMSSNAITEDGELFNIDGNGNRVAALTYGPSKVYIVAGENKIVTNVDAAIDRLRNVASPMNGIRLHKKTPCAVTGNCNDCASTERMCSHYVLTRQQGLRNKNRIAVLLVKENLGY
ncbi:hypothetical protein A4S06_01855 [Erysipelotrichaceae bacterium MTC7]|nr:hypothetical protein A4S06_01855 [Erysipelotrichaceae bacterium MTC7]